jgi:hypothetical protein
MQKILEEVPEIKILEDKLNLSKNITDPLDKVIAHLENATSIVGMAKKKPAEKSDKKNDTKGNDTKKDAKPKTPGAKVAKKDDGKAKDDGAKKEEPKKEEKKGLAEAEKQAQVTKPSAIIDATPASTVVITKG